MKVKKILADKYLAVKMCIGAAVICFPIYGLINFALEKKLQNSGNMPELTYSVSQTETEGIEEWEGTYYSNTEDPQILIEFEEPVYINHIQLDISFNNPPGQAEVYYAQKPGQGFSAKNRLFPNIADDEKIVFDTKVKKVTKLRIDPAMYAGIGMNIQDIHINGVEKNLGRYIFNADQALAFLIICLFVISPVVIVKNVFKPENRQPQDEN